MACEQDSEALFIDQSYESWSVEPCCDWMKYCGEKKKNRFSVLVGISGDGFMREKGCEVLMCDCVRTFCHNILLRTFGSCGQRHLHRIGDVADVVCVVFCVFYRLIHSFLKSLTGNTMYKTRKNNQLLINSVINISILFNVKDVLKTSWQSQQRKHLSEWNQSSEQQEYYIYTFTNEIRLPCITNESKLSFCYQFTKTRLTFCFHASTCKIPRCIIVK